MKDEDFEPLKDKYVHTDSSLYTFSEFIISFLSKVHAYFYIYPCFYIINLTESILVSLTIPHFSIQIVIHSAATIKFTEKIQFVQLT